MRQFTRFGLRDYDVKSIVRKQSIVYENAATCWHDGYILGNDRKYVWADATIDGETVIVRSDKVLKPVAVRYAWADNPICNLYNRDGLPASPFRTE
ncbi:MAG: hypothetical protein KKD33_02740 [Verrucomicrobia bacterium]|nr:hypothetical protein [Verrucomicrobiota bacterium]MBU4285524.1 hypothetical protein [Verrucomicrobiota bacterium]MBU4367100.1 hypothetical protein [Verrucomicrobiota bacterium]